jgi:hypothetical protein
MGGATPFCSPNGGWFRKFRGVRTYRVADPASSGSLAPYCVKGRYESYTYPLYTGLTYKLLFQCVNNFGSRRTLGTFVPK